MDYFEEIRILTNRAFKLRYRADWVREKALEYVGTTTAEADAEIDRLERLAEECEKRARHAFYDARHEAYKEARRKDNPTYRKRLTTN